MIKEYTEFEGKYYVMLSEETQLSVIIKIKLIKEDEDLKCLQLIGTDINFDVNLGDISEFENISKMIFNTLDEAVLYVELQNKIPMIMDEYYLERLNKSRENK